MEDSTEQETAVGSDSDDDEYENDFFRSAIVEGAGAEVVNGVYHRNGSLDGAPRFSKTEHWREAQHEFSLFRCDPHNNTKVWYISIVPKGKQPGNTSDIDFYSASLSASEIGSDCPPSMGWNKSKEGQDPVPSVVVRGCEIPRMPILQPVGLAFKNMLFSEEFSDVKFICGDGTIIHAHKCVLAAFSSYFKAAFTGPWNGVRSGEHKTNHPSHIVRAMLAMMYTGEPKFRLLAKDPLAFLGISAEYNLPWLRTLAENACTHSLDATNLKDVWQAGRLYDSTLLRTACIRCAKQDPLKILASSSITRLQVEDPPSWKEFSEALLKE